MAKAKPDQEPVLDQSLSGIVGYNLKRAYIAFADDFKATEALDGISARLFAALCLIADFPNINQSELARKLGIERSGMVKLIDQLEDKGFIQRVAVAGDRRAYALVATADGRLACSRYKQAVEQHEAKLLAGFTSSERQLLLDFLHRLQKQG